MSTYTNKTYRSDNYQSARPTYPDQFFDYLAKYVGKDVDTCVDLGCGTGQATRSLARIAKHVHGVDNSEVMIAEADKTSHPENVDFRVGNDSTIASQFSPNSVDLLTVAEAAHWLTYPQFFNSAHTVLKKGGTLAFWAYRSFTFEGHPEVADIINRYTYGDDQLGALWDDGRNLLNDLYARIVPPSDQFDDVERHINDYDEFRASEPLEVVKKNVPVSTVIAFLRTYSPYHTWLSKNSGQPDIVSQVEAEIKDKTGLTSDSIVNVKWDTVYVFARAK